MVVAMAGRSMPSSVLEHIARHRHQRAGIAGGNTGASLAFLDLRVTATRIEESFFLRSATSTGSSIVMTSVAGTMVTRG
jgi:hypothetical protein